MLLNARAYEPGGVFDKHHDGDDDQQNGRHRVELVAVERGVQGRSYTATADNADDRGLAEIDVEAVERQTDETSR